MAGFHPFLAFRKMKNHPSPGIITSQTTKSGNAFTAIAKPIFPFLQKSYDTFLSAYHKVFPNIRVVFNNQYCFLWDCPNQLFGCQLSFKSILCLYSSVKFAGSFSVCSFRSANFFITYNVLRIQMLFSVGKKNPANWLPLFTSLDTIILPPCNSTSSFTKANPMRCRYKRQVVESSTW